MIPLLLSILMAGFPAAADPVPAACGVSATGTAAGSVRVDQVVERARQTARGEVALASFGLG